MSHPLQRRYKGVTGRYRALLRPIEHQKKMLRLRTVGASSARLLADRSCRGKLGGAQRCILSVHPSITNNHGVFGIFYPSKASNHWLTWGSGESKTRKHWAF